MNEPVNPFPDETTLPPTVGEEEAPAPSWPAPAEPIQVTEPAGLVVHSVPVARPDVPAASSEPVLVAPASDPAHEAAMQAAAAEAVAARIAAIEAGAAPVEMPPSPAPSGDIPWTDAEKEAAFEKAWTDANQVAARVDALEKLAVSVNAYNELVTEFNVLCDRVIANEERLAAAEESLEELWEMHREPEPPATPKRIGQGRSVSDEQG